MWYLVQLLQFVCVQHPVVVAQPLGDDGAELGVAERQPSTRSHSIGLVLKLLGPQLSCGTRNASEWMCCVCPFCPTLSPSCPIFCFLLCFFPSQLFLLSSYIYVCHLFPPPTLPSFLDLSTKYQSPTSAQLTDLSPNHLPAIELPTPSFPTPISQPLLSQLIETNHYPPPTAPQPLISQPLPPP